MKFTKNVDILVHIVYAKFKNFYLYKMNLAESGNSINKKINHPYGLTYVVTQTNTLIGKLLVESQKVRATIISYFD